MYKLCTLLLGFVAIASAEISTEPGKHCTWGPSFWCSSVRSAKDCGAVQFCIRNTWTQSSFLQGINDDNTCTFCKKLVTDIRDYVTADQTEQAIVAFADKACASLSDKFIADECKGIANLYIVQIISMLRQNMDPTAVCHAINLCASADMFLAPAHYRPYFAVSQDTLTRLAVDKLKTAKVDGIVKVMAANTAKHSSSLKVGPLRSFAGSTSDQCDTCKEGVRDVKAVFNNTQVRSEVTQIIKSNICPRFILPSECDKLIDDYAPEIYQTLVNLDPTAACETIGLCQMTDSLFSADSIQKPAVLPMMQIKPARVESNRLARTLEPTASVQCVLCEYVVSTVMQALQDNKTDQEVIAAVTHVCNYMPNTVKAQCQQFIAQYGEELIDLLTHSTDPQTICALIGLCSGNQETKEQPDAPKMDVNLNAAVQAFMNLGPVLNGFAENSYETRTNKNGDKKIDADNKCFMCRIVANYLISILNENVTAQAVEHGLDKVCNFLPENLSKECQVFVDQYTTQLLAVIMSSLNTQTICQSLELCPATAVFERNGKIEKEQLVVAPFAY